MLNAHNCIDVNAALSKFLLIWWHPILNRAVCRYRNWIGDHMTSFTFWHKTVYKFIRQVVPISERPLQFFFILNPTKKKQTKIVLKRWCATVHVGVEGVKWEERTFSYLQALFLPLVFWKKVQQKLYWIFNCDFCNWPLCTFTNWISKTRGVDTFWCMQWHQKVISELIALYFYQFSISRT